LIQVEFGNFPVTFSVYTFCPSVLSLIKLVLLRENEKRVWRPNTIKHYLVTDHFNIWPPCLVLFDRAWSIKFEGQQTFDQTT